MRILIDGYNLLHASTVTPTAASQGTLDETRNALLDFLLDHLPPGMAPQTVVVFDQGSERGLAATRDHGQLTVMFAVNHPEADDLIEELIQTNSTPRRLTVVSSDHRIHRAAKRRKARAVDSDVWLQEIQRKANASGPRPEGPVPVDDDWLEKFQDVDVDAIQRDVEAEFGDSTVPEDDSSDGQRSNLVEDGPAAEAGESVTDNPVENPFPAGYGEDVLREELDDSPFPRGYGEDLLDEE